MTADRACRSQSGVARGQQCASSSDKSKRKGGSSCSIEHHGNRNRSVSIAITRTRPKSAAPQPKPCHRRMAALATHKTLANGSAAAKKSRCVEAYCKHLVKSFDGRERRVRSGRIYRLSSRSLGAGALLYPASSKAKHGGSPRAAKRRRRTQIQTSSSETVSAGVGDVHAKADKMIVDQTTKLRL